MNNQLRNRLQALEERHTIVANQLAQPDITNDIDVYKALMQEIADLEPIHNAWLTYIGFEAQHQSTSVLLADAEMHNLAVTELQDLQHGIDDTLMTIKTLLLPKDKDDGANVFVEIRAGTGGSEAALFCADLQRMYLRFAEQHRWTTQVVSISESEQGGYREIITRVEGKDVYRHLKFESGAHRVQRVPATESQGRIHTSACTVAVLVEPEELAIQIDKSDLRIDTFRSSGAGGQHVNTTDSAIRITHVPTGVVVECQDERSQHKNKARALSLLGARLEDQQRQQAHQQQAETRRNLIGSGDRSQRIRTYNFPQGRMTDHRIGLTLYKLDTIVEGDLDETITALQQEHQARLMAGLADE